jgi:2-polyprenyl-3-methyl-5-hydroxy-6-metoxy-1,4-benzoquinol methylase
MNPQGFLDYYALPGLRELAFLVPPMNLWRIKAIRAILRALDEPRVDSVLEIACATGILTRKLARRLPHSRVLAIDISEEMIRAAVKAPREPNIDYRALDFFDLEGRYPLVLGMHILHMLPLVPFVDKLRSVVLPGGRVVLSFTCSNPVTRAYRWFYRLSRGEEVHLSRPESVLQVFRDRGFVPSLSSIDAFEGSRLLRAVYHG